MIIPSVESDNIPLELENKKLYLCLNKYKYEVTNKKNNSMFSCIDILFV